MGLYDFVLFVHVAASVALLSGSVIASPAVRRALRRAASVTEMRAYLRIGRPLHLLEPVSAFALLFTGLYLTTIANFWSQGWVQVAMALWVVNSVLAGAIVTPALKRLTALVASASEGPPQGNLDALRGARRWLVPANIVAANDAATLYVMVLRPSLTGSLVAVAVANALFYVLELRQAVAPRS